MHEAGVLFGTAGRAGEFSAGNRGGAGGRNKSLRHRNDGDAFGVLSDISPQTTAAAGYYRRGVYIDGVFDLSGNRTGILPVYQPDKFMGGERGDKQNFRDGAAFGRADST